jgi:hypothetical protein
MKRNFSMEQYWNRLAENWTPLLHFSGQTKKDWQAWRAQAQPKFMELLGEFPKPVPLEAEVEYCLEEGNLIRERVVFQGDDLMSVPCEVLRPKQMKADHRNAAIVCSHGHGPYGKDPVARIRSDEQYDFQINHYNYDYGWKMAEAGFLTISPDLRVFGERSDGQNPFPGRDKCNVNFLKGALLGIYTLTLNIWDIKRCIDYLETRAEVDPKRIGMIGLSQGGTMTTFTSAAEPRIKAANICGYVNTWKKFGIERANCCGSQIVPSIYKYLDTDDIAGLIAPRALLVDMGMFDKCFPIQDLLQGYEGVRRIYQAAGVEDRLWSDIHPHGHSFGGNKAAEFFRKYL